MPTPTPQELQEARRRSGRLGGRPRKPRPAELEAERINRILDKAWKAVEDGLETENGRTRLQAAKEAFDRIYGRPAQTISGEDGGPVEIVVQSAFAALKSSVFASETKLGK